MKIISYIIVVIIVLYILDYFIQGLFCRMKMKRKTKDKNQLASNTEFNRNNINFKQLIKNKVGGLIAGWIRYRIIQLGKIPCHAYRIFILKYIYKMNLEKNVVIYGGFEIRDPWNISIGQGTIIGDNAILDGRNGISIGKNANLSTGVWIWTNQHDYNDRYFEPNGKGGKVIIGDRVWLSSRVSVLPGIKIDDGAVIAGGGCVTKDCEPFTVYGGVPAKRICERNKNLEYEFNGEHIPFF